MDQRGTGGVPVIFPEVDLGPVSAVRRVHQARRPAPWLARANEAVLPFYVLRQTVLLTVGFYVLSWPLPDLAKWAIIAAVSFIICVSLYAFVVRRINVLRVLFGMKPAARSLPVKSPVAPRSATPSARRG